MAVATPPERHNASRIVERQVEAGRADKPAFVAADATLTYEQLRRQVNRAGHLLRQLGIGREHRVLLVLDDTTVFPIVFLGAMRIGAVPVPVSHLDKEENFRHYVEDSYASVVVTDAESL
ncbi:MAG TPA: AMP-binding protein, partial [Solirubrobacteraceae bacterium]